MENQNGGEIHHANGTSISELKPSYVGSASNGRTVNNAVRHQYRVLSDAEKAQMTAVKDKGSEFLALLDSIRTQPNPVGEMGGVELAVMTFDRELNIASEKIEEAVMWAVKHITA